MTLNPDLEDIAAKIHAETGIRGPVDAFVLAEALGVECRPTESETGFIAGDVLYYPRDVSHVRQQGQTSHELGHWVLEDEGLDPSNERHARYLAGALMLLQSVFLADMERTARDLSALRRIHVNASAEMIAVRMTQVGGMTAAIWEKGELLRTYGSPNPEHGRDIMMRTLERGEACRGPLSAYPIFDGNWRRVIVIG
jgi:hypothetical protein